MESDGEVVDLSEDAGAGAGVAGALDAEGGGAAAAGAAAVSDILTQAHLLGAPAELPLVAAHDWVRFASAPAPNLEIQNGRVHLQRRATGESKDGKPKLASDKDAYAVYFEPVWEESRLKLKCRVGIVCSQTVSYMVSGARGVEFPFKNALDHLLVCIGRPLMCCSNAPTKKVKPAAEAGAGGGSAIVGVVRGREGGRNAITTDEHLDFLGLDYEQYKSITLKQLVADALPFSFMERPGEALFLRELKLPSISARTLKRCFEEKYEDFVAKPAQAAINAYSKPQNVSVGGFKYELVHNFTGSADGVKVNNHTHESVAVSVATTVATKKFVQIPGRVFPEERWTPPRLEPKTLPLALIWWEVDKFGTRGAMQDGAAYCANAHADLLANVWAARDRLPRHLRRWLMDTTNGNPAVLKEDVWNHAMFLECLQHLLSLCVLDLMRIPAFNAAHESCRHVCVWLKGSSKRIEYFKKCFKEGERVLMPLLPAKARFGTHLIQMERAAVLAPAMAVFNARIEGGDVAYKSFAEFTPLYATFMANKLVLQSIVAHLTKPVMSCIAAVGSDTAYTSGLRYDVFEELWEAGEKLRAVDATKAVGICWQNSMLERISTHHLASAYCDKDVHTTPTFLKAGYPRLVKKLEEDSLAFSCMLLDPACSPKALDRCPDAWQSELATFLYKDVIRPAATLVGDAPPPPSAASTSKPLLAAEITSIKARSKPKAMGDATWAATQEADIAAAKARYASRGDKVSDADGEPLAGAPADPYMPLFYQLGEEIKVHATFLHEMRSAASAGAGGGAGAGAAAAARPPWSSPFGRPLSRGTDARYEFWPSRRSAQPLMLFCAEELLAACRAATAFNERLHSPAQRIGSKLRNRLKPRTTEQLTLAYHFLREDIKKLLKEMGPEAEYLLDVEDLERMDNSDLDDILAHADAAADGAA